MQTSDPGRTARTLGAARAVGVVFGGSVVAIAAVGASLAAVAGSVTRKARPPLTALVSVAALVAYLAALRPWLRSWGATAEERRRVLPGDELVPDAAFQTTRAVAVEAPVDDVWPWLAQIGQDRGGFYSYAWLENLAGCRLQNADRIHPEWQERSPGDKVMLHPLVGIPVARFEPGHVLVLEGWGSFVLEAAPDGTTRLLARSRIACGPGALFYTAAVELPHFVMERRMLLGLKERAEAAARDPGRSGR